MEEHRIDRISKVLIAVVATVFSLFHLYTGLTGTFETYFQRISHLFLGLILLFLMETVRHTNRNYKMVYFVLVISSITLALLTYMNYERISEDRIPFATSLETIDLIIAGLGIILLLEGTRKAAGFFFSLLTAIFIVYVFVGPYMPGIFNYGGTTLELLLDGAFLTTEGIFGIPIGASATFVALFVIFGAFMEQSGIGDLIMDVANGVFGRYRGGPAKGAVVAAGAFGSIDGNATADVMVTGSVNIPMMKRVGYKSEFAGGVEAAAAAGGVLLPPVMGTVAFIMADYTGIPYSTIMMYALIPALLYYVGIFSMVHFQSIRLGLRGLQKDELPDWKKTLKEKWHLLFPIVLLVVLIVNHYSIMLSVSYSIVSIVVVANLRKGTRMGMKKIYCALVNGAKGAMMVTMATAAAGLMIYIFSVTGLGLRFTENLVSLSQGILFIALLLTMVATILLGMGVPPTASYLIQVAVTIPPVVSLLKSSGYEGDPLAAAHMFVMYFASMAVITPPVALAAFAAAGIAKSDPLKTGLVASKLAFTAFIIPYLFVYYPEYLMQGAWHEILLTVGTGLIAIIGFGGVFIGYFIVKLNALERTLLFVGSAIMLSTNLTLNIIGFILYIIVFVTQWRKNKQKPSNLDISSVNMV